MVDCMLSYAATTLVKLLLTTEGAARLELLKENPKRARQFLLLAYLYSHCDSSSLSSLRKELVPPRFAAPTVGPDIDREWAGAAVPISSQGRYFCGTINRGECIHRWWPLQLVCTPRGVHTQVVATAVGLSVGFGAAAALHASGIKGSEAHWSRWV